MDPEFWHARWRENRIGFHQDHEHPALVAHITTLSLVQNARVFLPLCGKTHDIHWLRNQGYRVVGAELSELAVRQVFDDLGTDPEITDTGVLRRYSAPGLELFAGDIFDLQADQLGSVDAVYDRAALVALPPQMRGRYCRHLAEISGNARQLLITFEYEQNRMSGPPFSVPQAEVSSHYAGSYAVRMLDRMPVAGGLKGLCPADELALHLTPLATPGSGSA